MFVARGDALAVLEDRKIKADILTAHLRKDENEESKVYRVDAFGSVLITTPTEISRGEKGVYFVDTGIATLTGAVKITRGDNQLNGMCPMSSRPWRMPRPARPPAPRPTRSFSA